MGWGDHHLPWPGGRGWPARVRWRVVWQRLSCGEAEDEDEVQEERGGGM